MINYRVTKYDPKKRNEHDQYIDGSEWREIDHIGKSFYNSPTYEEYEKVETNYIEAIKLILKDNNLDYLLVDRVSLTEKSLFKMYSKSGRLKNIKINYDKELKTIRKGKKYVQENMERILRLILRNVIWLLLKNKNFEVRIGYDLYMYIVCDKLNDATVKKIECLGLFIEEGIKPILFID